MRRGEQWGVAGPVPAGAVEAWSDADVVRLLVERPVPAAVLVRGGDLHRTLGAPVPRDDATRVDVDLLRVDADGHPWTAAAHVVARRPGRAGWWRGPLIGMFNAEFAGRWDVAPRAHPGDGRFDVIEVDEAMSSRQRFEAWRRLPSGTHVPHPQVTTGQARSQRFTLPAGMVLYVDGLRRGPVRQLAVDVDPGAATVFA